MITTGSKFFIGVGVFGAIAAIAYAAGSDNERLGIVVLATLAVAGLFLAGVCLAFRDSNVATAAYPDGLPEGTSTIGRGPLVSASVFPAIGAFGAVLLVLGMVFDRWMVWAGAAVLAAAVIEWTVQSWSDRASDDGEYNRQLRRSLMQPFEFPVLGILAAALVVFGFSRVMLSLTKTASVVAFVAVAVAVLVVAGVIAGAKRIGGEVIIAALMVGGIIILTAGVIGAVHGERGIEAHSADEGKGGETVANTANIVARLRLTADSLEPDILGIPRSIPASVTFTNDRDAEYRLVVEVTDVISPSTGELEATTTSAAPATTVAGATTVPGTEAGETKFTTPFVKDGQTVFLTFQIDKPGTYAYYAEPKDGGERVEGSIVVS